MRPPVAPGLRLEAVAARRGVPFFFSVQAECQTCGVTLRDPLLMEELGRFCSRRCYHAAGLPFVGGPRAA